MLTKNIASEYGEFNIQCNGMGPGYIATAQTAPLRETQPDGSRHPFDQFILCLLYTSVTASPCHLSRKGEALARAGSSSLIG